MMNLTATRFAALFAATLAGISMSIAAPAWAATYSLVYSFQGGSDGANPESGLTNLKGKLYGTTYYGGARCDCGTVFSVTTAGSESVVYQFSTSNNAEYPIAGLINASGTLYGTTLIGGSGSCPGGQGCGVVFSLTPAGVETPLYSSPSAKDGWSPDDTLLDVAGTLYGTTEVGGAHGCGGENGNGCGTVYAVTSTGALKWVYPFKGGSDGQWPQSHLLLVGTKLYGTTSGFNATTGTVFSITTDGIEKVLYKFKGGSDGENPYSGLVDVGGKLYGTTEYGGGSGCQGGGCGTVFSVTARGVENILYAFQGGNDGEVPQSDLVDVGGTLYGTSHYGGGSGCGGHGCGTVFSLTTAGVEQVIYSFGGAPDGLYPISKLINVNGTLWGTTYGGGTGTGCGSDGCGVVFKINP